LKENLSADSLFLIVIGGKLQGKTKGYLLTHFKEDHFKETLFKVDQFKEGHFKEDQFNTLERSKTNQNTLLQKRNYTISVYKITA
jgi:hypothetical protein